MWRKYFFVLLAMITTSLTLAATLTPVATTLTPVEAPLTPFPNYEAICRNATADAKYFVPINFYSKIVPSPSGQYGYREGCPFWIVDFSMNKLSNSYGKLSPQSVQFSGIPYDLPSSKSKDGISPIVQEDCNRLLVEYIIYEKFAHEAAFNLKMHIKAKGAWESGQNRCGLTDTSYFEEWPPQANILVVRVATRVKLRTSWQEAAGFAIDGPPE